jgi:hypothetical protein
MNLKNFIFTYFFACGRSAAICPHVVELNVPQESLRMTCANPLQAAISFLGNDTPTSGPCVMFYIHQRFDRFREWLISIGGYVSHKISFKQISAAGAGIFLNPNEFLVRGEQLFVVPDIATFNERTVRRAFPWLVKFEFAGSVRFWQSVSLAALLRNKPEVVGPWQALLPDMSFHPSLWPASHLEDLRNTYSYSLIRTSKEYIEAGCRSFQSLLLDLLDLSCRDVLEAHAIIVSRGFGLEKNPNASPESSSAIPFGPDLLNHSPHSVSWTSHVKFGSVKNPTRIETLFMLLGYTLDSKTRELFNNYGSHAFPHAMAMYGFTSPDSHDELVIHATTNAVFDGKRFDITTETMNICPSTITIPDIADTINPQKVCPSTYVGRMYRFDHTGSFRLTNRDVVAFFPHDDFLCPNFVGSFVWDYAAKELAKRKVKIIGSQLNLFLNTADGTEPWIPYENSVWMALCSLPAISSKSLVDKVIQSASSCDHSRNHHYMEEFPRNRLVQDLSRRGLFDLCSWYEEDVLGTLDTNLRKWIAYRNLRILRTASESAILTEDIALALEFSTDPEFKSLLDKIIVEGKNCVFSDNGGIVDRTTAQGSEDSVRRIFRLEEVYRYKMQTVYLVIRKCRQPLEYLLHDA